MGFMKKVAEKLASESGELKKILFPSSDSPSQVPSPSDALFLDLDTLGVIYAGPDEVAAMEAVPHYVNASKLTPEEWVLILRLERGGCKNDDELRSDLRLALETAT